MIKKKKVLAITAGVVILGACVGGVFTTLSVQPLPEVEYRAVCRGLPANAHWNVITTDPSRVEIPQTESSPNVWTPSPVGSFNEIASDEECRFVCDIGYKRENGSCIPSRAACETETITIGNYTIASCNVGATVAGTGKLNGQDGCTTSDNGTTCWSESIGDYFQRGNNYGFPNSGTNFMSGTTKPNASGYGPTNWYTSGTFIKASSDWSSVRNDNLRGGSGDLQANGRDTGNPRTQRQGPCPDGFHVPSAGEWSGLVMTWWNTVGSGGSSINTSSGLPYFSDNSTKATKFRDDFLLPLAGRRLYGSAATVNLQGYNAIYWSSSPNGPNARYLTLSLSAVNAYYGSDRANGFSLRCFQNS